MSEPKEIKLGSGAVLRIQPATFEVARELFEALLAELKAIRIRKNAEVSDLFKDLFCIGFSAPRIKQALAECMKRCTYNCGQGDMKIDKDTFEPVANRVDYLRVCMEVAKENVNPFGSDLYVLYKEALAQMPESQA